MKIRLLFFSLVFPVLAFSQWGNADVQHYKFEIELNDANDSISGRAEMTCVVKKQIEAFYFDIVYPGLRGKGMTIDRIFIYAEEKKEWVKIGFVQDSDGFCVIGFDKKLEPGSSFKIAVVYKGIPDDGLIISKNKFGKRTFFSDNWPNRAHHWIPCVDDPADKATVEFIVTAPSHYQVVSNGLMIEETSLPGDKKLTHYKEDVPLPTKVMVIGVADFAVNLAGEVNCVPVYSWVFPEEKKKGFYDYALAKEILSYYTNYIGPFPYKKLANVQSKTIFGGMENAGAIFYHENSIDGRRGEEYLLAHEIVHQWFGDMATEKSFPHLWLSEGFATYLTQVYAESKIGFEKFNQRMKDDRDQVIDFVRSSPKPVVDSATPFLQLLNPNSYQRGSWVLHMLRRQLGDSVFKRGVRMYYEQYKGKNAETKDLQAVFEKTSGKKLDSFFRQWLFTPEIPRLNITWQENIKEKTLVITVKQLQKSGPFSFPLDIFIQQPAAMPLSKTILVNQVSQTFTFPVKTRISNIKVDPFISLLYEGTVTAVK